MTRLTSAFEKKILTVRNKKERQTDRERERVRNSVSDAYLIATSRVAFDDVLPFLLTAK